jgi:hypothetical protein
MEPWYDYEKRKSVGNYDNYKSAQSQLKVMRECRVCALGGMFISYAKLFNKVNAGAPKKPAESPLLEFFTQDQLILIEEYFEGWNTDLAEENLVQHTDWRYSPAKDRLKLIMKNIIKNDGTFCPEQLFV